MYRDPRTGKFVSKKTYEELTGLLEKQEKINQRLEEIETTESVSIPELAKEVVKYFVTALVNSGDFDPDELILEKPTLADPVIRYEDEILCWFIKL